MKKIISVLLVMATMLSCFVMSISATAPTGEFTTDEGMLPFEDVKDSHWFAEAVEFCYANEIIKGMNEYTFGFSGQLTRAQFVTMLANLEGVDTATYTVDKFTDVKSNHWYYGAVAWAYSEGVVNGMTDTTFQPNGVLTRAQLAVVMRNYMEGKYEVEVKGDALDGFTDKPKTEYWYYDAMVYAVSAELLSGNSDGTLASTGTVTRAQAAVIFKSFMEKYFYGACEHSFTEADCTNAETCENCGLVNGLPNGHRVTGYNCVDTLKCNVCDEEVAPSNIMHNFADATCTAPRTCTACGVTRGEAKGHKWTAATCTAPKTCSVCKVTEGSAKSHEWWAATCTNPKMCKVCYKTEGSALGHTVKNGLCSRCKKENFTSKYRQTAYYMVKKAEPDGEGHYVLADYFNDADLYEMVYGVYYDAGQGMFALTLLYFDLYYGDSYSYTMVFSENSNTCDVVAFGADINGNSLGEAVGTFDISKALPSNLGIKWATKTGTKGFDSFLSSRGHTLISNSNRLLKSIGSDISAFGFNVAIW